MSDTPRTDAQLRDYGDNPSIFPNFARQLERELADATAQLAAKNTYYNKGLELLFNANKQLVKELAEKDTVPRTRYDACNKDWLEERELRKKVQNDSHNIIVDLEAQLAGFNGLYNTDAKLINRLREQLAEKDKQIEEIVDRAIKTAYGYGGCPVPKCSVCEKLKKIKHLEAELAEAKEQLAEKDKMIEEIANKVMDKMSSIVSENPSIMEYETDARDTWPNRWGELLKYLKALRDIKTGKEDRT